MLSGIRTGKRKRKEDKSKEEERPLAVATSSRSNENLSAAEELRQLLQSGGVPAAAAASPSKSSSDRDRAVGESAVQRLERHGKILPQDEQQGVGESVVLTGAAAAAVSSRPDYRPEDFRHGSRKGKLKRGAAEANADEPTVEEMLREEKESRNNISMDELYARNVARVGSRYKGQDFVPSSRSGADEDDNVVVDMTMFSAQKLTNVAAAQKEKGRQIARHDAQSTALAKCWWWMESPSFRKHEMLLSLGDHVSLVLAPLNLSLTDGHCYLVPVKNAESFVACEDDVWEEVQRFQTSLRNLFAKEGKGLLFCETVLPSKQFWQARMEVIPVPKRVEQDAPMYFKSALTEQAEEWGTHNKLLAIKREKGLRRTVPIKFPYFYVGWENGGGFAQIIETSNFPKDFGVDTIAGILDVEPIRFKRKQKKGKIDGRGALLDFCKKWQAFDWTLELDEGVAGTEEK